MHEFGVRGARFNMVQAGATSREMVEGIARKIAPLGWHCEFNVASLFERLPVPAVIDHCARLPIVAPDHPAVAVDDVARR